MMKPITFIAAAMALLLANFGFAQAPNFSITPASPTQNCGGVQTYEVKVTNFTNLTVAQFAIRWNSTKLSYESASVGNLAALSGLNYGTPASTIQDGTAGTGQIKVAWGDLSGAGQTLAAGTTLFSFKLKAVAGTKDTLRFSKLTGPPGNIEFVNSAGNDLTNASTLTPAIVTIVGCNVIPPPQPPPAFTGFGMIAGNKDVLPAEVFEIPVSVQDFNNIASMQYSILFDATKIQFITTTGHNVALSGIDANPQPNGNSANFFQNTPGKISFTWSDGNAAPNGVTLPNGTVIYKLRFKNLMPAGDYATVNFGNAPMPIEIQKSINNATSFIPFGSQYGIVASKAAQTIQSNLTFYMDTVMVGQPNQGCLKVKVDSFVNVESFQFTHEWDPSKISFGQAKIPSPSLLPGFSITPVTSLTNQGILAITWSEPQAGALTLPKGSTIYEVCFNTTAASVGDHVVKFDSTTTVNFEVQQRIGGVTKDVKAKYKNGLLKVTNTPTATNFDVGSQQTNVKCAGGSDGSIDLIVTPAVNPGGAYTYSWTGPPGFTSQTDDISNLKAGVYNVTVTCLNLTKTRTVTITEAAPIGLSQTAITQVSCFGGQDGAISITTTGGQSPFSYKWTGPNGFMATSKNISNRTAGTYTVMITDANNCTFQSSPITIGGPAAAVSVPSGNFSVTHVSCFGGSNGAINLSGATGGTSPYSYEWGPAPFTAAAASIGNLKAGSYIVTVTDSKGCSAVGASITVDQPTSALQTTVNTAATADVKCFGGADGKAGVNASGGTSPYTFSWFGGGQTSQNVVNLVAGTYICTISDSKGCTKTQSVTVNQPNSGVAIASVQTDNVKCAGQSNGKITVNISTGGTAPYIYTFSGGTVSGNMASNLAAGTYGFTVTDASQCSVSDSRTITAPAALGLTTAHTNQVGNVPGSVSLTVAGGTSPFSYVWTGPNGFTASTEDLPTAFKGAFNVLVTDANGCTATATETVGDDSKLSITCAAGQKPCWGSASGQVVVTMTDGVAPYAINWTDGSNIANSVAGVSQNPYTVTGLFGGAINITVTDANGSTATCVAFLTPNSPFSTDFGSKSPTLAGGFTDGRIKFVVVGGTPFPGDPHYTFSWTLNGSPITSNITNQVDTSLIKGLDEGKYCVTATDAVGCTVSKCTDLVRQYPPLGMVDLPTPPNCKDSLQGAIAITTSGGDQTYTYKWAGPNGFSSTNEDLTKLVEGIYTVTVTDSRGETLTKSFNLVALSHLTASVASGSTCGIYDICNAEICDGAGSVTYSGQFGNANFLWSNGETSQTATALCDGLSTVVVSDAAGCKLTLELSLSAPATIVATQVVNRQVTCFGDCDGSAQVTAIGGILPHAFKWSNGETGQVATKLCAGENFVTITDAEGIEKVEKITLDSPDSLKVTLEVTQLPTDFETEDAIVTAIVMGGPVGATPVYFWNVGGVFDNTAENLGTGDFILVNVHVGECKAQAELKGVPPPADGCGIGVPVITPGLLDGKNDLFEITCSEVLPNNRLEVYNRWGQLVFEANNYQSNWDGTFFGPGGKKLAEGVYFYLFTYEGTNGEQIQYKNYVTLLRGDDE